MVEKMLDPLEEYLLELPYQKRIRQQSKEEGFITGKEAGLAEGVVKGKEAGLAEGKEVGELIGLRKGILEAITVRFDPHVSTYRPISEQLESVTSAKALQRLLTAALQAGDIAAFTARLAEELPGPTDEVRG